MVRTFGRSSFTILSAKQVSVKMAMSLASLLARGKQSDYYPDANQLSLGD
ncbi:MAG TPA: hypothetical protein VFK25_08705 [Candidatus Binatia bacterium]|nr:hypothetical protein [Candidatus Binatia bacterium]